MIESRDKLRKAITRRVTVTVDVTDILLLRGDANRISVLIVPPLTNRFTIRMGETAVLDSGITLYPGIQPLTLTLWEHGQLVMGELRAIGAVAAQEVTVYETLLIH